MKKHIVVCIDGASAANLLEDGADGRAAVKELRAGGTKAWLWPDDLAEMTSAETLLVRNGFAPEGAQLKNFPNNEKNRDALFAMAVGGGIEIPASGEQATGSEAAETKPGAANERKTTMTDQTAKTKKTAAKKKAVKKAVAKKAAPAPRVKAPSFIDLPQNLAAPAGTSTGCYIRSLIMKGKTTEEILEKVAKHYPESTAKGSDVSWNRQKLRADGVKNVPEAVRPEKKEAAK